jgi:hypothetical protein
MRGAGPASLAGLVCLAFTPVLHAQSPYRTYLAEVQHGVLGGRVRSFVSECTADRLPRPEQFYSQGGWFRTEDLAQQTRDQGDDDDATAEVWFVAGKPRAVYQWTHDDEFDRDLLACLDPQGRVIRTVSRYMPGGSEPNQHWIYLHTQTVNPATGQRTSHGRFTTWSGQPIGTPRWSQEDQDFIAGEPVYRKWTDFDFAKIASSGPSSLGAKAVP